MSAHTFPLETHLKVHQYRSHIAVEFLDYRGSVGGFENNSLTEADAAHKVAYFSNRRCLKIGSQHRQVFGKTVH